MRTYIKKLQSKSESTRKQILVVSLVISMSFVGVIWVTSLGYKFSHKKEVAKTEESVKPFVLFGQTVKDTFNNVTASVGNISSSIKKEIPKENQVEEKTETENQIDLIPIEYTNQ